MKTRPATRNAGALLAVTLAALLGSGGALACTPAQALPQQNPATGKLELEYEGELVGGAL